MLGLERHSMYTLLDVHQDGLLFHEGSSAERGYYGVPQWMQEKLVGNDTTFPWPFKKLNAWVCRYFTQETSNAFGRLYQNYKGAADEFAKFWGIVAHR